MKKKTKTKPKKQISAKRSVKKWSPKDTKFLYPTLTDKEAKEAWELGW